MEIERVNEFTIKFFISYGDIEDRGFDRDEIWSDRERGEELFWEMMDEANQQEQFPLEGPLWIQVQALDKGLEIIVTRAQMSKDGTKLELPLGEDKIDFPVDKNIETLLDQQISSDVHSEHEDIELADDDYLSFLLSFKDLEDLIMLSHNVDSSLFANSLYHFENNYFLFVTFHPETTDREQDDLLAQLLEYGSDSDASIYQIQEYGNQIIAEHALQDISTHFSI